MPFGNLAAQHQSNTRSPGFRGKEWNKQISGIGDSRPFVADE
jgi:hypothetical protein